MSDMVKGMDNTKTKKKTFKNKIERDTELLQGAYFGGKQKKEKKGFSEKELMSKIRLLVFLTISRFPLKNLVKYWF